MDESARAEALAALDAFLRLPGEIFTEEWEGYAPKYNPPGITTSWFVGPPDDRVNAHLETSDNWRRAWDSMRENAAFDEWYAANAESLGGSGTDVENEVIFEERAARSVRVSHKGNLVFRVPYTDVWDSPDEVAAQAEIIHVVLARRARAEGIPPPPPAP
jgi:hypothetical protein